MRKWKKLIYSNSRILVWTMNSESSLSDYYQLTTVYSIILYLKSLVYWSLESGLQISKNYKKCFWMEEILNNHNIKEALLLYDIIGELY